MTITFISRHPATIEWAKSKDITIDFWESHLHSASQFKEGDTVIGTLPIQLVAELNTRGVEYIHFSLSIPEHLRGVELTTIQLEQCLPQLQSYSVIKCEPSIY